MEMWWPNIRLKARLAASAFFRSAKVKSAKLIVGYESAEVMNSCCTGLSPTQLNSTDDIENVSGRWGPLYCDDFLGGGVQGGNIRLLS